MNDLTTTISIGFSPALPCCTIQGALKCGKEATAGTLYPTSGGNYILQPFCRDCTQALLRVYEPQGGELFPEAASDLERPGPRLTIIRQKRGPDD